MTWARSPGEAPIHPALGQNLTPPRLAVRHATLGSGIDPCPPATARPGADRIDRPPSRPPCRLYWSRPAPRPQCHLSKMPTQSRPEPDEQRWHAAAIGSRRVKLARPKPPVAAIVAEPIRPALVGGLPYPMPSTPSARANMRANRRSETRPEVRLRSLLHRLGYRFRKDYRVKCDGILVHGDVVFTKQRLVIFVDGCFWHACPVHGRLPSANRDYWQPKLARNVARDRLVDEKLRSAGWTSLRIWEHTPAAEAINLVQQLLPSQHR